jgi:RecB family exonuclease
VSQEALLAGYQTFGDVFIAELQKQPNAEWRTAGRKTKAMPNGEDKDWWAIEGTKMVRAYYDWRMSNPNLVVWDTPQGVPAIELAVNITLPGGVMFRGFIDRVFQDFNTGELIVVDTKSGKNTPPPIQLAMYRMALEQTFGFSPKYGAYWMARQGTLDTIHDLDRFPPRMVSRWLRDTRKAIDLRLFSPHVSKDCSWCSVQDSCYTVNPDAYTPNFDDDLNTTEGSDHAQ